MVAPGTGRSLRRRPLAVTAATIAAADAGIYLWLIAREGDGPAWWFVAGLCTAILLGGYGTLRTAPWQGVGLAVGGTILLVLGVLGIFSVGLPLLVAGLLLWIAAAQDVEHGL